MSEGVSAAPRDRRREELPLTGQVTTLGAVGTPGPAEVAVPALPLHRYSQVLNPGDFDALVADVERARQQLGGRTLWDINSTASGGGVAELLPSSVGYAAGAGISARWAVISGDHEFFLITKRIHNQLHGAPGDGGALDTAARSHYESVLRSNAAGLAAWLDSRDLVTLHDPQTAGLIPLLRRRGVRVVWRCHVGVDHPNRVARGAWDFLLPYVTQADAEVFSCEGFVWDGLDPQRVAIIAPAIDPFAVKNRELSAGSIAGLLQASGVEDNDNSRDGVFIGAEGKTVRMGRVAEMVETTRLTPSVPLVVQVSRWDRLKDPLGVLRGFAAQIAPRTPAHLLLAGPSAAGVSDDPEGLAVFEEVQAAWRGLPEALGARVHLATLSMDDVEANAVLINALQRRADVIVQKSLAEGFGLTVAEAMWKARPVVASALGGMVAQIEDERSGILVDPADLERFGAAVSRLLTDRSLAAAIGQAAKERVRSHFLGSRQLRQMLSLWTGLLTQGGQGVRTIP